MRRILIIRTGAVGDCVLTAPVLTSLRQSYADISIELLGNRDYLSPLVSVGLADASHSIDRPGFSKMFFPQEEIPSDLGAFFGSYDAVLSFVPDPERTFSHNLLSLGIPLILRGTPKPDSGKRIHITRHLMLALKPLDIDTSLTIPFFTLPPSELSAASKPYLTDIEEMSAPPIALHPGSGGRDKCWPAASFAELVSAISEKGCNIVLTSGPADDDAIEALHQHLGNTMPRVLRHIPLRDLGCILGKCAGFIGNDTGITHLAAATGIPTIALFGPTDPAVWGPRGRTVRILWGNLLITGDVGGVDDPPVGTGYPLESISVDCVLDALQDVIPT